MAEYTVRSLSHIASSQRLDSEYFTPSASALVEAVRACDAVPLSNFVSTAMRGRAPEYDPNGTVPVVRTANVRDLAFSDVRQDYVTQAFYDSMVKGQAPLGTILVTSTGVGTLGRVFSNLDGIDRFADGHITVLTVNKDVDIHYLTAVLQSGVGRPQLEHRQRGSSGQIEIYPTDILSVLIPTLPDKLKRQVSTLWREAVEAVKGSERVYPDAEAELLDRMGWRHVPMPEPEHSFVQSVSQILSSGRADAEHFQPKYKRVREHLRSLESVELGSLLISIARGAQPEGYFDDGPVIVVKSKDVRGTGIDLSMCDRTNETVYENEFARLKRGDVVMNATGLGTLGRVSVIPALTMNTVAAVDLFILRTGPSVVAEYLALFLNSPAGLSQSHSLQTGSSGQLHLYPEHLPGMLIYAPRNKNGKPDLAWQNSLADKVRSAAEFRQDAKVKLNQAKRIVEKYCMDS